MSDSVTSAPVCDSHSYEYEYLYFKTYKQFVLPVEYVQQRLLLSLFQLPQNLRPRDAERLKDWENGVPTAYPSRLRLCHVSENRVLSPNNGTREHGGIRFRFIYLVVLQTKETSAKTKSGRCRRGHLVSQRPPTIRQHDQLHLAARQQERHLLDLCLLGACLLVTTVSPVASCKKWTCPPEIFWHVSDIRIGTISNPAMHSCVMCANFEIASVIF